MNGERRRESQIKVVKRKEEGRWVGGVGGLTKYPVTEQERKTDAERGRAMGREDENIYAVASVVRQGRLLSL